MILPMDWMWGFLGGLMIGGAAALYLLANGRIMGASGLLGGVLDGTDRRAERWAFLAGLIGAPALAAWVFGPFETNLTANTPLLLLAGVLVGIGTRLANGCTSGHGVCGISRLSLRGLAATACYLGAGFATMWVARHLLGAV